MQVREIAEGCVFEPNQVYVIPAGEDLRMDGEAFNLVPAATVNGWPDAFDIYLDSVAKTTNRRAVTVILSGMSEDGSAALKDLRTSGGLNYAQSDASSRGMPDSAVRTGMVDYVGSADEIAAVILGLPVIG
jgi:chemotaxis response regulator CheB